MVSASRGWAGVRERAALVDGGHRPSRHELSVEQRDSVASLTSSEEMFSEKVEWSESREVEQRAVLGVMNKIMVGLVQRSDHRVVCGSAPNENEVKFFVSRRAAK